MKRLGKTNRNTLDKLLAQSPIPSHEQMQSRLNNIWERLRSEIDEEPESLSISLSIRPVWTFPKAAWVAIVLVVGALSLAFGVARLMVDGPHAIVESLDGTLYRLSGTVSSAVRAGDRITSGETIRSENGGAALVLGDGSRVEMRSRSELLLQRADDGVRIRLIRGSVIVAAVEQPAGHLYVETNDVVVSVVGTVFLVNAEEVGSRVAVIEGQVHVQQGKTEKSLSRGQQHATNPFMESLPVTEEIGWSRRLETHVALLQQSSAASTGTARKLLEFEAASIKPEVPIDRRVQVPGGGYPSCKGIDGVIGGSVAAVQGRCTGGYVSLQWLIAVAYGLEPSSTAGDRIVGLEPWMTNLWKNGFQINAKAENLASVTKAELRQMLQTLLAERFKLKATRETRKFPGYLLTVGKNGTKLSPASTEEPLVETSKIVGGNQQITVKGTVSLEALADHFDPYPVFDRTNLKGLYAVDLTYIIPSDLVAPAAQAAGRRGEPPAPGTSPRLRALQSALRDQLGLELEYTNVPAEFVIIEHAEQPTDN